MIQMPPAADAGGFRQRQSEGNTLQLSFLIGLPFGFPDVSAGLKTILNFFISRNAPIHALADFLRHGEILPCLPKKE